MDPQQRLLLEIVYEAMESAGYTIEGMQGSCTSVYVGGMSYDFRDALSIRDPFSILEYGDGHAVQSLRSGEANVAVATGSNLILGPEQCIALSNLHMLSLTGYVRMWDKDANGYARGEGFAAVMLKTVNQALQDGDRIESIIRETGVGQDGRTTGITMRSAQAQASLITQTYSRAGLDPRAPKTGLNISKRMVLEPRGHEGHLDASKHDVGALLVGSIKTVLGHLEGAAGMAGLLKASLAVQNGVVPPKLHFNSLNPKIAPYYHDLRIATESTPWPALSSGTVRRASVNSFGFGRTNAHCIIESFDNPCPFIANQEIRENLLIMPIALSAKSKNAVARLLQTIVAYLSEHQNVNLEDLAFTFLVRHNSLIEPPAYAAGYLTAHDAIRIAYYRGLYAKLGHSIECKQGGIIVVGMSYEDAVKFCARPTLVGRICAAASNGPSSSTLSGDSDAIDIAKALLDEKGFFARRLMVDTAYHSHHMQACSAIYHKSMEACAVEVLPDIGARCKWISSVYESGDIGNLEGLQERAVATQPDFDIAIKVGPHPALKGPAMDSLAATSFTPIAYHGTLRRGHDSVEALAALLGFSGSVVVLLTSTSKPILGNCMVGVIDLPPYSWDHQQPLYKESRLSSMYLKQAIPSHELLGTRMPNDSDHDMRWRNLVSLKEVPWLKGHQTQGQTVLPAMWYVVMVLEATKHLQSEHDIRWIEIQYMKILKAVLLEDTSGIEKILTVNQNQSPRSSGAVTASFSCSAGSVVPALSLDLVFQGSLIIYQDDKRAKALSHVDTDRFYSFLQKTGLGYSGLFRNLKSIQRKGLSAKGTAMSHNSRFLVHPSTLDLGLQSMLAALFYLDSDDTSLLLVPQSIKRLILDTRGQFGKEQRREEITVESTGANSSYKGMWGDVSFVDGCGQVAIQLEGVAWKPLTNLSPSNDHKLFAKMVLEAGLSSGKPIAVDEYSDYEQSLVSACDPLIDAHAASADLRLIKAVGENLPIAIRENRPMLEFMVHEDKLHEYYNSGHGYPKAYAILKAIVGAGTGGATRHVLNAMGNAFSSYAFTDVSTGFFEKAQGLFREEVSKVKFKIFDLERVPQSLVIHATKSIKSSLFRIRSLLKPGGYFVLVQGSADTLRSGFMMGGLPGWWVGGEDRKWGPMISEETWDNLLRKTGFSAICRTQNLGFVLVSQAIDDRVILQRKPLDYHYMLKHMTVVGGGTPSNLALRDNIRSAIERRASQTTMIPNFGMLAISDPPASSPVLVLAELDEPVFKQFTPGKLQELQKVFTKAQEVLIVTRDNSPGQVHSAILLGLVRSLRLEIPHLRIQFLTITDKESLDARVIVETFLRLLHMPSVSERQGMLWTFEPELRWGNGVLAIPRIVHDEPLNSRLNANHRLVRNQTDPSKVPVEIVREGASYALQDERKQSSGDGTQIAVSHSTLYPIRVDTEQMFLCLGMVKASGQQVVALSKSNCSIIKVPKDRLIELDVPPSEAVACLYSLSCILTARCLVARAPSVGAILIHNGDAVLRSALKQETRSYGRRVVFSSSNVLSPDVSIHLHPFETQRQVEAAMGNLDITMIADCSPDPATSSTLRACLPVAAYSRHWTTKSLTRETQMGAEDFKEILPICMTSLDGDSFEELRLCSHEIRVAVQEQNLEVETIPITKSQSLFLSDKTYIFFGLAGSLGQSLRQWAVEQSARYVILTSRSPQVDPEWISELARKGVTAKTFALDISNHEALRTFYSKISHELPPVAGIANGAMVLRDGSFYDMTYEAMETCSRPKIDGSRYLDELFGDNSLDFFIMFSSIAWVVGNPGQCNYSAANGYMSGLARARKRRGLAASVISLGVVGGVGYLARTQGGHEHKHAQRRNVMTISEVELHESFAEAIIAGSQGSNHDPEIVAGLDGRIDTTNTRKEALSAWLSDPRVSHLIVDKAEESVHKTMAMLPVAVSVKQQLESSSDPAAASQALVRALSAKLEHLLLLPANSVFPNLPLIEMGVDSLLAVEIRSWFVTELSVDVPVLKILGGASVATLSSLALTSFNDTFEAADGALDQEVKRPVTPATPSEESASTAPSDILQNTPKTDDESVKPGRKGRMSYTQERMWRLNDYIRSVNVNNLSWAYSIKGAINKKRFQEAFPTVSHVAHGILTKKKIKS
ncbi:MAG: hypothetical protein Q9217_004079 [Psora testacea]